MNSRPQITSSLIATSLSSGPIMASPEFSTHVRALLRHADAQAGLDWFRTSSDVDAATGKSYEVKDGMAVIPISGALINKVDAHAEGWFTGYPFIANVAAQAAADPSVNALLLQVSSHGGDVYGMFELREQLAEIGASKPVYAIAEPYAHSAGYALLSVASKAVMPATGSIGSIGVITMTVDYSAALAADGVKVELHYKGKRKADGNPYTPMTDDARAAIDHRLEQMYTMFVDAVASSRGLDPQAVRDTEAGVFTGQDAVRLGLVDAVVSPRDAMAFFQSSSPGERLTTGVNAMTTDKSPVAAAPDTSAVDAAVQAERSRIGAILSADAAKGRTEMAHHLAFKTGMSADDAVALLAMAPAKVEQQPAAAKANPFEQAMQKGNPEVSAEGANADAALSDADKIIRDARAAGVALDLK